MGDMPMPGGWAMSMMWMRAPGQTWPGAAASFLTMWIVMMVAMMLPSLLPMLRRYGQAVGRVGRPRLAALTAVVALAYFAVWAVVGMVVFPLGVVLATIATQQPALARAVPGVAGMVVLIAGAFQFTASKTHYLACCREAPGPGRALAADVAAACRHGLRLGLVCCCTCANLMAILAVIGMMNPVAMGLVTSAITAERLAPSGRRVARATGIVAAAAGLVLIGLEAAAPWTP
jgi:predicted metal-binding membrane protein